MSGNRNHSGCRMQGGICACHSGGSYGGCVRENCCAATLPAAPAPTNNRTFGLDDNGRQVLNNAAPTHATAEQEAEIDAAVTAGRVTFEPGWDDPRPDAAPTGQAGELPLPEKGDHGYRACSSIDRGERKQSYSPTQMLAFRTEGIAAALAARQAPTAEPKLNLCEHLWHLRPASPGARMTEKCRFCNEVREIATAQEQAQ